jgi:phosphopantothenoylcysteine decarboxylase/phosphopantothenate--cysteine ligase
MHTEMWNHEATQKNVQILESRGVRVLAPESGRLTGSDSGTGRLPEPGTIVNFALDQLAAQDLKGRKFLVTAGGTQEPIDPVRFLGNRSSGKQGIAIALEAQRRGAKVTLVAANVSSIPSELNDVHRVQTAKELSVFVNANIAQADCLVMTAAVADYRVQNEALTKLKKSASGPALTLELIENEDILRTAVLKAAKENIEILTVGFAAETSSSIGELGTLAFKKLEDKGCDLIVANDVSNGKTFDSDSNEVLIVSKTGMRITATGSKSVVAAEILDAISGLLKK